MANDPYRELPPDIKPTAAEALAFVIQAIAHLSEDERRKVLSAAEIFCRPAPAAPGAFREAELVKR